MPGYSCSVCGDFVAESDYTTRPTPTNVTLFIHEDCTDTFDDAYEEYTRRAKEQGVKSTAGLREMSTEALADKQRDLWERVAEEHDIDPSMQSPK